MLTHGGTVGVIHDESRRLLRERASMRKVATATARIAKNYFSAPFRMNPNGIKIALKILRYRGAPLR
jgi:hypothetical protein